MKSENQTNDPVTLDDTMKQKALQAIRDLRDQSQFFAQLIAAGNLHENSLRTHMGLLRHQHDDLAQCFELPVLNQELEDAYASCRQANAKVAELEKCMGEGLTTRNALARMRLTEEWLQSWYTLRGFQYAKLEWGSFGIRAEFSSDIDKPDSDRVGDHSGNREFKAKVEHIVPYLFGNEWDKREDSFHDELLDTERNRHNIKDLVRTDFPDARVIKISSRIDHKDYLLRFEADFPWEDIERWHDRVLAEAAKQPSYFGGEWFARIALLKKNKSDKSYRKYASPEVIRSDEKELKVLEEVTATWKSLVNLSLCGGAPNGRIDTAITVNLLGASRHFEAGAPCSQLADFICRTAGCDMKKDLAGCGTLPWDFV